MKVDRLGDESAQLWLGVLLEPAGDLLGRPGREANGRVASRLLALAGALSGMRRAQAAEAADMDRQTLRDWVLRYNVEGVAGLRDRPKGHRPEALTEADHATVFSSNPGVSFRDERPHAWTDPPALSRGLPPDHSG